MSPNLDRISMKARANSDLVFTSLYHHIADTGLFSFRAQLRRELGPSPVEPQALALLSRYWSSLPSAAVQW